MYLNIDTYEHLLTFLDDKTVLNALSVNTLFMSEIFFKRILRKRYSYTMRFKNEHLNWREYFIQVIYYLKKLEEKNIPYLPVHDFNVKDIYEHVYSGKMEKILDFMFLEKDIKRLNKTYKNNYHTIAIFSNSENKYVVTPNLIRGASAAYLCLTDKFYNGEIIIDIDEYMLRKLGQRENIWLSFITENENFYAKIFDTKKEAILNLEIEKVELKDDDIKILRETNEILEIQYNDKIYTYRFQTVKINIPK